LKRFFELAVQRRKRVIVREFESCLRAIQGYGKGFGNQQADPFTIISVDCEGNVSTFSPELLGLDHPTYGSFSFGNVLTDDYETLAKRVEAERAGRRRKVLQSDEEVRAEFEKSRDGG